MSISQNNPFAQDMEALSLSQAASSETTTTTQPPMPADHSILEERTISNSSTATYASASQIIPEIRIDTTESSPSPQPEQPQPQHIIPEDLGEIPAEAPPAYSETDPHPSPMGSPLLSSTTEWPLPPRTPPRPVSPSGGGGIYQRPPAPPPLHLDTQSHSYSRPLGPPPPQRLSRPTSPRLSTRPVSPRLPPRPSSQYPGRSGATYYNNGASYGSDDDGQRPPLPQRRY